MLDFFYNNDMLSILSFGRLKEPEQERHSLCIFKKELKLELVYRLISADAILFLRKKQI